MKNINKMMGFHINKNFYSPDKNCKRFWWGFYFFTLKYLIHGKFFQPSVELNHIEKAFKKGYIEIIDLILKETNCSINHFFFDNWTSLHFTARYNNTDLIHYILTKKDVNVNARNKIIFIFLNQVFFYYCFE